MASIHALIADQVSRSFGAVTAVHSASLSLTPGEITALIGPSGSGKTTFLRLLAGMERPDAGEILSGDTILANPARHVPIEKRKIGLVFQDFALFPNMTVLQNVMFGLRDLAKPERVQTAETWINQLGLSHRRDAYPHHLSGGEQQRTAIARALAPKPVAILLDEPFSGLDPSMRERVRDAALNAIRSANVPALLVTHDASEALIHADTIAVIDKGRILQTGTPEAMYRTPNSLAVARALGPVHKIETAALPETWRSKLTQSAKTLWYRPEAVLLGAGLDLTVRGSKLAGPITELCLSLTDGGEVYAACQPGAPLHAGDRVQATINPALFFEFASEST
ncbi:MAG: ABC transporter ATP-binding protein [Pseudomonadota bacterium]